MDELRAKSVGLVDITVLFSHPRIPVRTQEISTAIDSCLLNQSLRQVAAFKESHYAGPRSSQPGSLQELPAYRRAMGCGCHGMSRHVL